MHADFAEGTLTLNDNGRCTCPISTGVQRHACKRIYVIKANQRLRADDIWEGFPDSSIR